MKGLSVKVDRVGSVLKAIKSLAERDVLVGVPDPKTDRKSGEPITNAQLAYIHDNGSPVNNIPARPFMRPGIKDAQDKIDLRMKKAAEAALSGSPSGVDNELASAGLVAQNSIKSKINSGDFVPLALSTLRARAARGRKGAKAELESRAAGNPPNPENARPLIDTGQMRNAITYVVRNKK